MADTYSVSMNQQTIIANATLVIVHSATGAARGSIIEIDRAWASQGGTNTAAQIGIELALKASAFGTYVSATPANHALGGPASGIAGGTAGAAATCGVNASAEGAGTVTVLYPDNFNNLNGWLWVPTPEERILVPPDTALIMKILGTPASLTLWTAGITYTELV